MKEIDEELFGKAYLDILEFLKNVNSAEYEIEARLGRICEYVTHERIYLDTSQAIIFNRLPKGTFFDSGIEKKTWNNLKMKFGSEGRKINDKVFFYKNNIRKFQYEKESDIKEKYEIKERKKNINIYIPWLDYDIRISISKEKSITQQNAINIILGSTNSGLEEKSDYLSESNDEIFENKNIIKKKESLIPEFTRLRERETFLENDYSYDFTIIKKNDNKKGDNENYELEIEIINEEYNIKDFISKIINIANLELFD